MRHQWFTLVRLLVAHLTRCWRAFSHNAHYLGSLPKQLGAVWIPRLHGEPGGPSSITGIARIVSVIYSITALSFQDTQERLS
jgi:hypothetical protein